MPQLDLFADPLAEWRSASYGSGQSLVGPCILKGSRFYRVSILRQATADDTGIEQAFVLERWNFSRLGPGGDYLYRRRAWSMQCSTYLGEQLAIRIERALCRRRDLVRCEFLTAVKEARRSARR